MGTITKTYNGTYFKTYAAERAELISQGYKVIDENLITKTNENGSYVTGSVVFKKENFEILTK